MAAAWQEAGSGAGAQLQCSQARTEPCQEPQCGTHRGPKPCGVRPASEGLGCGASDQCPLQPQRALWLLASEQKVPSKGERCSSQVHSMLAFILKLPFCGRIVTLDLQTLHPVPIQGAGKG